MIPTVRAFASLLLALQAAPAFADEPAYESTVHARPLRQDGAAAIVLTAGDLAARNVQNLAEALDLIPELSIRQGGMGTRLDLRGAKQRSILLLIDGIPIDEPYFGAFDLSAIPVTDIVEIRVQLSPASPLEGPGGDGGIIEVATLHAVGPRRVQARLVGATEPGAEVALGARVPLSRDQSWGLRGSAGASVAEPGFPVLSLAGQNETFYDRHQQGYGALRLEHQGETGRFALDGWYGHRTFNIPPSDSEGAAIQHVTGEDAGRVVLGGEITRKMWRIALGAYGEVLQRNTDFYGDYTLTQKTSFQDLLTARAGTALTLERPWHELGSTLVVRFSADGEGARIAQTGAKTAWGISTYGELAMGSRIRWRMLRAEASLGALVPFEHAAATWPEAKLTVGVEPNRWVSLLLIGARKGRLPTVRELYDPLQGNANLKPEMSWHGELRLELHPHPLVRAHTTAYVKQIDGFIRLDPNPLTPPADRKNLNLDTIEVRGFEGGVDVAPGRIFGGGVSYLYQDASSATLGTEPIPNMPRHRVDAYLSTVWRRRLGALLRFRYVDSRIVQNETLTPYEVLDLTVWGKIARELRASLRIDNLTNNHYQQLPDLRVIGTTATLTVEGVWE
jgi:outer membrane cobalamin receptor